MILFSHWDFGGDAVENYNRQMALGMAQPTSLSLAIIVETERERLRESGEPAALSVCFICKVLVFYFYFPFTHLDCM